MSNRQSKLTPFVGPALRFGQGPQSRARIQPSVVGHGATFELSGAGFKAGEPLRITVTGPSGQICHRQDLTASLAGELGPIQWRVSSAWRPGSYSVEVQGTVSRQQALTGFTLL